MIAKKKIIVGAALIVGFAAVVGALLVTSLSDTSDEATSPQSSDSRQATQTDLLGESFINAKSKVSMRLPKNWKQTTPTGKDTFVATSFHNAQLADRGLVYGELAIRPKKTPSEYFMSDVVSSYSNAGLEIDSANELNSHYEYFGDIVVSIIERQEAAPNGQSIKAIHYVFIENDTDYTLTFILPMSEWELERPAIEASAKSMKFDS